MGRIILLFCGFLSFEAGASFFTVKIESMKGARSKLEKFQKELSEWERDTFADWLAEYWLLRDDKMISAGGCLLERLVMKVVAQEGQKSVWLTDGTVFSLKKSAIPSIFMRRITVSEGNEQTKTLAQVRTELSLKNPLIRQIEAQPQNG